MKNSYTESLAHTTWECKYHIVFAPKFRRYFYLSIHKNKNKLAILKDKKKNIINLRNNIN